MNHLQNPQKLACVEDLELTLEHPGWQLHLEKQFWDLWSAHINSQAGLLWSLKSSQNYVKDAKARNSLSSQNTN